jgi:copper chaperone CopZ
MAHLRINIGGMTGVPCQQRIEDRIRDLHGVHAVVICLERGHADVEYADEDVDPERILAAIADAGYAARIGG